MKRPLLITKITGKNIYIKLPRIKDAPKIFEYTQNPELTKYVTWQAPGSLEDAVSFVKKRHRMARSGEKFLSGVYLKKTGEFVGSAGYIKFDDNNNTVELGYWVAKPFQRQGIARECVNLLSRYAFIKLNAKRIIITCTKGNIASRKLAESIGFIQKQFLRKHVKIKNRYMDRCVYCLEKSIIQSCR